MPEYSAATEGNPSEEKLQKVVTQEIHALKHMKDSLQFYSLKVRTLLALPLIPVLMSQDQPTLMCNLGAYVCYVLASVPLIDLQEEELKRKLHLRIASVREFLKFEQKHPVEFHDLDEECKQLLQEERETFLRAKRTPGVAV